MEELATLTFLSNYTTSDTGMVKSEKVGYATLAQTLSLPTLTLAWHASHLPAWATQTYSGP